MMLYSKCNFPLLVLLVSIIAALLVMASANAESCGNDNCCLSLAKVMTAVIEINAKLDEQAHELKLLKADINANLASTTAISTQFARRSVDLLQHNARLQAPIKSEGNADQLLQSKCLASLLYLCS